MVGTIESAAEFRVGTGVSPRSSQTIAASRAQTITGRPPAAAEGPSSRTFTAKDLGYITVEPDGRDDIGFRDRLRQAIETVARTFASREGVAAVVDRIFEQLSKTLDDAEAKGEQAAVQIRIASLDVAVADRAGGETFASIRQFALEIGVARNGEVAADDVRVLATDGRNLGLSTEQLRAGFRSGSYNRTDTGGDGRVSEAASKRLEAARNGLERVKAVQDALSSFRLGDETPLRRLFEGDGSSGASPNGTRGQVFPGVGLLSFT
jgi:hypothetical protein